MMISTMIMAIAEAKMYVSVFDAGGAAVGATVGWASETVKDVCDHDGQYALVPWKVAVTVKSPDMSGTQEKVNIPEASVVAVPMFRVLPFESVTSIVTGTPVKSVGIGCCWYTYSIHPFMLASDATGTPLGN